MNNKNIVRRDTAAVIFLSLLVYCILIIILVIFDQAIWKNIENQILNFQSKTWMIISLIAFILVVISSSFLFVLSTKKKKIIRSWTLYIFCIFSITFIFSAINCSGGISKSPFISLYALLLTVGITIIISDEQQTFTINPKPMSFLAFIIIISLILHFLLSPKFASSYNDKDNYIYFLKYSFINAYTLLVIAFAEILIQGWESNSRLIKRIRNFFEGA